MAITWRDDPGCTPTSKDRARARTLRYRQTEPEQKLWWHLRHRLPTQGTHFRRQVPIGPYVADFCCPDYIVQMLDRIRTNWVQQQEAAGVNKVKFTIQRDGRISDVVLEKSSGFSNLDLASQRALLVTKTLNPLPPGYPNASLTMHLNFEYLK